VAKRVKKSIIETYMVQAGVTRQMLAEGVEVDYSTLSKYITCERELKDEKVAEKIADYFTKALSRKIFPEEFLGDNKTKKIYVYEKSVDDLHVIGEEPLAVKSIPLGDYFYFVLPENYLPWFTDRCRVLCKYADNIASGRNALIKYNDEFLVKTITWSEGTVILSAPYSKPEPPIIISHKEFEPIAEVMRFEILAWG